MNKLYSSGREKWLRGEVSWNADTIRVVAVDSGYVQSDAHDFLNDVAAGARVATSSPLAAKTTAGGVADGDDVLYPSVAAGSTITGLVVYKDTGVETTSVLLAWIDTKADGTPISVPTDGNDIVVRWRDDATRILRL